MTPKNKTENVLYWLIALAVSVLLAFLSGVATHWPENGPIDMRGVWLDVIQAVLAAAPFVVAGLGLPRLGKEAVASLVSEVGAGPARAALEVEAMRQATGVTTTYELSEQDVERITRRGLEIMREQGQSAHPADLPYLVDPRREDAP